MQTNSPNRSRSNYLGLGVTVAIFAVGAGFVLSTGDSASRAATQIDSGSTLNINAGKLLTPPLDSSHQTSSPQRSSPQAWPNRPIRIVHALPQGFAGELATRQIAAALAKNLEQIVTISNRPGAGGLLATGDVAQSAPDGYTFLACDPRRLLWPELSKTPIETGQGGKAVVSDPTQQLVAVARGVMPQTLALVTGSPMQHQSGLLAASGLCAHKDTPTDIIEKMRTAYNQAMTTPSNLDFFKTMGALVEPLDGEALRAYLTTQRELIAAFR